MKLKKLAALTVFVAALSSAATAKTVSLDLETIEAGTILDTQFEGVGVTFSNARIRNNGAGNWVDSISNPNRPSPSNPIRMFFLNAASFVSVSALEVGLNGFRLRAYDALSGGNLLDSQEVSFPGGDKQEDIALTVSGSSILRVEISQIRSTYPDYIEIDGLTFSTDSVAPVPLPASLPLLAGAIGGFSLLRRRRARG